MKGQTISVTDLKILMQLNILKKLIGIKSFQQYIPNGYYKSK